MSKNIKLLALDFDGTILDSDKRFPQETVGALRELAENGVTIVASSGRGLAELIAYQQEMQVFHYGILACGGLIYDFQKRQPIFKHKLDLGTALEILFAGQLEKAMIHVLTMDMSAVTKADLRDMRRLRMGVYRCVSNIVPDIELFTRENEHDLLKIDLYHKNPDSRSCSRQQLKKLPLTMTNTEAATLELSPVGISKGSGLNRLCKMLNLDLSECAAIGDSPNDLEMLQTAGLSIAMGNASEQVKSACKIVTMDNDHNGVLQAIKRYLQ